MDDLIRRSDAIEAIEFGITYAKMMDADGRIKPLFENENRELGKAIERIKDIPAVEPCKDAISRADAIKEIGDAFDMGDCYCDRHSIIGLIFSLPSVTAETDIDDYMKGYDHGTADTWKIAQTVFGSTVTLYEAIDVVRCMKGADDETD